MSDAYEQIRVENEDVWKTAFATTLGTFVSHVMQQGDCNAPATFQRLMTWIFREHLRIFIRVYLDDIFVYSNTIKDHEGHLRIAFDTLRWHRLFLSPVSYTPPRILMESIRSPDTPDGLLVYS